MHFDVMEFDRDLDVDGLRVCVLGQPHPGGSVSLRLADAVCYVTDATPNDRTSVFAERVECLIHEAWSLSTTERGSNYGNLSDAIRVACDADIHQLIPIHFGPNVSEEDIQTLDGRYVGFTKITAPIEGSPIRVFPRA